MGKYSGWRKRKRKEVQRKEKRERNMVEEENGRYKAKWKGRHTWTQKATPRGKREGDEIAKEATKRREEQRKKKGEEYGKEEVREVRER